MEQHKVKSVNDTRMIDLLGIEDDIPSKSKLQ